MRVLIVDDGQSGDDLAHHLIAFYGAEIFRARTLADGLRMRTEVRDLDFIVFDLSYPDSSREESIELIPRFIENGVQLFVFTGYEEQELLKKSLEAGASDWFLKGNNHRGGSALGARMASIYYRTRKNLTRDDRNRLGTSIMAVRKEQAEVPKVSWFSTVKAVVTLTIVIFLQLVALGGFIWSQGEANALFRKQVEDNTKDIAVLKALASTAHDQNQTSIQDRADITRRVNETNQRYDELRKDMNSGFQRIYDILLQDRKTNADNRQIDQRR